MIMRLISNKRRKCKATSVCKRVLRHYDSSIQDKNVEADLWVSIKDHIASNEILSGVLTAPSLFRVLTIILSGSYSNTGLVFLNKSVFSPLSAEAALQFR